jgi:hypothetical protein
MAIVRENFLFVGGIALPSGNGIGSAGITSFARFESATVLMRGGEILDAVAAGGFADRSHLGRLLRASLRHAAGDLPRELHAAEHRPMKQADRG